MCERYESLLARIERLLATGGSPMESLNALCGVLRTEVEGYDWVGFYLVDPESERTLRLGPYAGEPTEHLLIPFGRGICGQAAERGETITVDDVSSEANYLACSLAVRSEIVVPVYHEGCLVGELDIDSHRKARFGLEDREFLEAVVSITAPRVAAVAAAGSEPMGRPEGLR